MTIMTIIMMVMVTMEMSYNRNFSGKSYNNMKYTHRKELLFPDFESKFLVTLGVVMWMVGIILTLSGILVGLPIGALF